MELQSGDLFWDLYNFAEFDGLKLIAGDDAVVMRWSVPAKPNPCGCLGSKFKSMELVFGNLLFLHGGSRDEGLPMTEDTCKGCDFDHAAALKLKCQAKGLIWVQDFAHTWLIIPDIWIDFKNPGDNR